MKTSTVFIQLVSGQRYSLKVTGVSFDNIYDTNGLIDEKKFSDELNKLVTEGDKIHELHMKTIKDGH